MPEKVTIREDLQVIQIDSWGDVSMEDLKASFEEVLKISQERGLARVLVDATKQTSLPSTMPIFQFASDLAREAPELRFGVVRSPTLKEKTGFFETVVRNRGAQVNFFETAEDALAWLMDESSKPDAEEGS
jgi:hypothetical protein